MTINEVAKELNLSVNTIQSKFKRTQKNLLKKGIILTKWRESYEVNYNIEYLPKKEEKKIDKKELKRKKKEELTEKKIEELKKKELFEN